MHLSDILENAQLTKTDPGMDIESLDSTKDFGSDNTAKGIASIKTQDPQPGDSLAVKNRADLSRVKSRVDQLKLGQKVIAKKVMEILKAAGLAPAKMPKEPSLPNNPRFR